MRRSVSVVCSDKTGTLTYNQMMATRIRTANQQFIVGEVGTIRTQLRL